MSEGLSAMMQMALVVVRAYSGLKKSNDVDRRIADMDARNLETGIQTLDIHKGGNVDMVATSRGEGPGEGQLFPLRGIRRHQAPLGYEQEASQFMGRAPVS